MSNLAPVIIFTYNRLDHTVRTLEALKQNILAADTDLFVFSDGPRSGDEDAVGNVRRYIDKFDGFKSIVKRYSQENKGLSLSITQGVSDIIQKYGKVIVLEDDLVSSPFFLEYMNKALAEFENDNAVWAINGWNPSIPSFKSLKDDVYFSRLASSWGWATWVDRWAHFEKNPQNLVNIFSRKMIRQFNLNGNCCFWPQVLWNISGKYNTWAIFWYATVFLNKGLCLSPVKSYLANIGQDGSGEHCIGINDSVINLNSLEDIDMSIAVVENRRALKLLRHYYREPGIIKKVYNKIKKMVKHV